MNVRVDIIQDKSIWKKLKEDYKKEFQAEFPCTSIGEFINAMKKDIQLTNMFGVDIYEGKYIPKTIETIENIMNFEFFILKNETGAEFYTSDHPILHFDFSDEEGFKVVFPLSPEQCLIVYSNQEWLDAFPTQEIIVNEWFVKYVNRKMIQSSYKFIYSRSNNFEFVRKFMENQ